PFDFFEGSLFDFDDCLRLNNISINEYENFERFENLEKVLSENVELKFKCNIKCQLEREPMKWLSDQGKMDLKLMNATEKAAESITKCMEQAPENPCEYTFKLVICAFRADHPSINYEDTDAAELAAGWEEEQEEEADIDDDDYIDY
ncbi:hypothetical protein KR009_011418, partial [Drosophila setifemur]